MSCPWLKPLQHEAVDIKLLSCKPSPFNGGTSAYVELRAHNHSLRSIIRKVESQPSVTEANFATVKPGLFQGVIQTPKCPCNDTVLPRLHLTDARPIAADQMEWTFITDSGSLKETLRKLEREGLSPKIVRVGRLGATLSLTKRQEQILRAALNLGFFEVPKKITLERLAQLFGTSPRAVCEVVRRGEKRAVASFLRKQV